jgi:class 3 adenylate cyclase
MADRVPGRGRRRTAAAPLPHDAHDAPVLPAGVAEAIDRFPRDNPNPVLRYDEHGHLLYANPASRPIVEAAGLTVGAALAPDLLARFEAAVPQRGLVEVVADHRTYALWPVRIPEFGFTNLYGMDVTAERAIVKFPDQNPNPVFRIDATGRLIYANAASRPMLDGLGLAVGDGLPSDLREDLRTAADANRAGERRTVEVSSAGRTYALLPVDVPEFGFCNVYGTDVTAVRELERLHRENERLLLNILPEPIAARLRAGERLIADRFDDVTLMFADIVEFTRLSSTMEPAELVGVLNEVFTVFDELVERYDLEKVKTIGDAYMVVGGMPEQSDDHTARVAAMALDLAAAVDGIEAARRLGIRFRIGINRGPIVAGVIGTKKFIYDVWGDTVNLASRMESLGVPGRVQVSGAVVERLGEEFEFETRGLIEVKGKGLTPTWFLVGRSSAERSRAAQVVAGGSIQPR